MPNFHKELLKFYLCNLSAQVGLPYRINPICFGRIAYEVFSYVFAQKNVAFLRIKKGVANNPYLKPYHHENFLYV